MALYAGRPDLFHPSETEAGQEEGVMLTEEQAREKWCPSAQVIMRPVEEIHGQKVVMLDCISANRIEGGEAAHGTKCIASDCMAWRWGDPTNPRPEDRAQWGGYCGLAGSPGRAV